MNSRIRWLDRLPGAELRLGTILVPTYAALGLVGATGAFFLLCAVAVLQHLPMAVALVMGPWSATLFVAWSLLRRRLTGHETLVLYEHLFLLLGGNLGLLLLLGQPVAAWLDVLAAGLAVFFIFGRLGCVCSGCCYGATAAWGITYGPDCPAGRPPARRLPVPLLEASVWAVIAVLCLLAIAVAQPGTALILLLSCYGVARFALEGLRADPRPHLLGMSLSRWYALAGMGLACTWQQVQRPWQPAEWAAGLMGLALFSLLWSASRHWWRRDGDTHRVNDTLRLLGTSLRHHLPNSEVQTYVAGSVAVAVSTHEREGVQRMLVSVSRADDPLSPARARLYLEQIVAGMGLTTDTLEVHHNGQGLFLADLPHPRGHRALHRPASNA